MRKMHSIAMHSIAVGGWELVLVKSKQSHGESTQWDIVRRSRDLLESVHIAVAPLDVAP